MTWWQWGIGGLLALAAAGRVGWKLGQASERLAAAMDPSIDHSGCANHIGRLSAALAAETAKTAALDNCIAWQERRIDQLEHEQARDQFDPVEEAEQILDREAGS
jgi:hypothetical protein